MTSVVATTPPVITPGDRLGLTICLAIILHGIIILGVTFAPEEVIKPRFESMEIILVQQESEAPEDAEFLAQASLEGGGDVEEKVSPSTPSPAPFPEQTIEETPPPQLETEKPMAAEPPASESLETEPLPEQTENIEQLAALESEVNSQVQETSVTDNDVKSVENTSMEKPAEIEEQNPAPETIESPPLPSATALLTNSFKIAALSAEIRRKQEAKAKRPRRKFISASTREYKYAAYMEAWRSKVERVGNLNYPDVARKRKLSGSLILAVDLNSDGSINQIIIRKSSGHKVLDDAAIRIVELAAPYAPFPKQIANETDILSIVRTWQFINNSFVKR